MKLSKVKKDSNNFIILLAIAAITSIGLFAYLLFTNKNLLYKKDIEKMQTQSTTNDVSSIEKDLNETDLSGLDKELNDIEKEINAAY